MTEPETLTLLNDVNADLSDALAALEAGDVSKAIGLLKPCAQVVRIAAVDVADQAARSICDRPRRNAMSAPVPDASQDEIEAFLLSASDEAMLAWAKANNVDIEAVANRGRAILDRALARQETPQQRYVREHGRVYPEPGTIDHKPIKPGRLGELPSKLPCVECPLARASIPGRLGGYSVAQYLEILRGRTDIACHLSPGFPDILETQRSCTGVAMYRANCGITASGHAQQAIQHTGQDREHAFANAFEFAIHHKPKD